jgi:hypothetical protein
MMILIATAALGMMLETQPRLQAAPQYQTVALSAQDERLATLPDLGGLIIEPNCWPRAVASDMMPVKRAAHKERKERWPG